MTAVEPAKVEPRTTNPATEEKETKSPDEDKQKTESVHIEADNEGTERVTPTLAPPKDSTVAIPSTSTEAMVEQDLKINPIIDEITKSDKEKEDCTKVHLPNLKQR
ncbi:hypothetical protein GOBAR_DD26895 [Gossypium barbadense]|nr:hypothetical protein GOBAR_DD26895 [Gossypium barbadense]